jgi:hypothetical protein
MYSTRCLTLLVAVPRLSVGSTYEPVDRGHQKHSVNRIRVGVQDRVKSRARFVTKCYQQVKEICRFFRDIRTREQAKQVQDASGQHNWKIDHLDVVTAFLNPKIDKDDAYRTARRGFDREMHETIA